MTSVNPLSIDLHGLRPDAALARLEQGLHTARAQGWRQVRVITGRGMSNRTQTPVLREKVEAWLRGAAGKRSGVQGFQRADKGGSLLVQLS